MDELLKVKYVEGDWVAIPLDSGGYAIARIARKRAYALLVYLFGKRFSNLPTLRDTVGFGPTDAVKIARTGNLGIRMGEWHVISQGKTNWKAERDRWPMPTFRMFDLLLHIWWEIEHRTDEPNDPYYTQKQISIERAKELNESGLYGHVLLCQAITKIIERLEREQISSDEVHSNAR